MEPHRNVLPPISLDTLQAFLDLLTIIGNPQNLEQMTKNLQERQTKAEAAEARMRELQQSNAQKQRELVKAGGDLARAQDQHKHNASTLDAEKKFFIHAREEQDTRGKQQDQKEARLNQRELMMNNREQQLEQREKQLASDMSKLQSEKEDLAHKMAEAKKFLRVA